MSALLGFVMKSQRPVVHLSGQTSKVKGLFLAILDIIMRNFEVSV